jgi:hypothetical protein
VPNFTWKVPTTTTWNFSTLSPPHGIGGASPRSVRVPVLANRLCYFDRYNGWTIWSVQRSATAASHVRITPQRLLRPFRVCLSFAPPRFLSWLSTARVCTCARRSGRAGPHQSRDMAACNHRSQSADDTENCSRPARSPGRLPRNYSHRSCRQLFELYSTASSPHLTDLRVQHVAAASTVDLNRRPPPATYPLRGSAMPFPLSTTIQCLSTYQWFDRLSGPVRGDPSPGGLPARHRNIAFFSGRTSSAG